MCYLVPVLSGNEIFAQDGLNFIFINKEIIHKIFQFKYKKSKYSRDANTKIIGYFFTSSF